MSISTFASALLLAFQAGADAPSAKPAITDLSQLPVEQAATLRCGVAFAIIQGAQEAGDERAKQWPDLAKANAREFFVRGMAQLMDDHELDRPQVAALVQRETERLLSDPDRNADAMMPACLMMLEAAKL